MLQAMINSSAGFRLTSTQKANKKIVEVRFDAVSLPESKGNEAYNNACFSIHIEPKATGWGFASPPKDSEGK